ncbi:phosphatase PAP2 family protein [Brachybacterium sp. YJGR34]|uniref:phosphatase PAP2 family protein n=1 Tax=Brachybacterium sp. YJGR34 TaxID=2059911 RepID=UPI000E0B8D52|nr:phosphatase PAP2 family protein [Brachybacterium sp. YJGR34]
MSAEGAGGGRLRPLLALLAAAVCAAAVVLLARTAVGTASGQRLDQLTLSGAQAHDGPLSQYAELAVETVSMPVIGALLAATVLLVLLRRRTALLLPLSVLILGANLTTQLIKHVLVDREALGPGIEITPNSFPSGHTTLAATAMVALVLASGRARVVLAPLGALWTAAAGIGTLVVGWHRPSDVVGGLLVVAGWTFLVLAVQGVAARRRLVRAARRPDHGRRRRGGGPGVGAASSPPAEIATAAVLALAGAAGLAIGALGIANLPRPLDLEDAAAQLDAFAATAAVIAGCAAAWMSLVLLLRPPISHRGRPGDRVP